MSGVFRKVLREGVGLRLDEAACRPLRSEYGQCRACASVCPQTALQVTPGAVALDLNCIACGRCVAVCPTDALALDGLERAARRDDGAGLEVECSRVPDEHLGARSVRVSCLGALSSGRLLELHRRSGGSGLVLVDRGACAGCEAAGGAVQPAQPNVDEACRWLEMVQVPPHRQPRIERRATSFKLLARLPGHAPQPPALSRRHFFRAAIEQPTGRDTLLAQAAARHPRGLAATQLRQPSRERQRQLQAIEAAAAAQGVAVPSAFFPAAEVDGRCQDHRVCIAACPTGALTVRGGVDKVSLVLSGQTCIGCGSCARACPEQALRVAPGGGHRESVVLTTHDERRCSECGTTFTSGSRDQPVCPSCLKVRGLVHGAIGALFGPRD